MADKALRRCCGAARRNYREKICGKVRMQRGTGVPGTDLTALTANSSVRRAVEATIQRRPPSGGRVLLQAYRLQSGRSELSASA